MSEALIITVVSASNLEPKDSNGLSDPYAIVECGKDKFRTKIIYKTLNPIWNESFTVKVHQGESIKVVLWDDDRVGGDDFEGQCHIDWWKEKDLTEKGEATVTCPLKKGHSITKKGTVKGTVTVTLRDARFAEKLAQRGELRTLFPDMPIDETIVDKVKCSFVKTTEEEDIKTVSTHPGTVFLLTHYFSAYAQTGGDPYKFDFAYEMIKSIDKIKKKNAVVVALSGGTRYLFKDIGEPESFIALVNTLVGRCANGDTEHTQIRSINEEAVAQEQAPCTIVFKVYVPDYIERRCEFGTLLTTNTNVTFKNLVEQALRGLGITEPASKFRLYSCPPAFREKNYIYKKYDSSSSVASVLKAGIINFGDVLILREYKKEDKKAIPLPSLPVPLLASKSTSEPSDIVVYHCSDAITKQGPLKITLDPEDTLSKVVKDACSRFGGDPAAAHICRVGYSADSDDYLSYVELNKADTADMTHMTSGDTLYVRFDPPFKTFSDKFGACDKLELMTYSMLCHCHNNPIHRGWKCSESPLQTAAARLGIEKEESEDINNKALDHAKYGVDAVLVELEDRMRNTRFNPFYASNSFENPNLYKKWFEEQRAEILGLMETAISNDYPFCCELHVKVISGAGLLAADIGGTSDPYCTVIYKTQRKSTSRVNLTLNPSWNETLVFNVTSFDSPLTFFVYDYDIKDDDLLGTASISLRDNMYILDGQPHELPPISLDKQGTITVQLTCYFDGSKYFNSVASYDLKEEMKEEEKKKAEKKEGEEEKCAQKLSCVDCYRLLYSTFNEDTNLTYERPLILKEFSTRFCVSNAYCSYLKLMTLFRHDGNLTLDMCKTILLCTRDLVRTTSTPNTIEEDIYVDAYKTLLQKIRERYVSECLNCESSRESADAAGKMLEPLVSISKEVTESRAKEKLKIDYLDTIKEAVRTGTAKLFAAYNAGFEWDNTDKVLKYSDVLSGTYTARIIPVLEMLGRVFGPDKTPALRAAVDSVETVLSTEVDRYIERLAAADPAEKSATSEMQGVQINVMKTIKALTALRAAVKEAAGGAAVHVEQGTGLIILWCRKSETLLKRWVESVVSSDKRERTNDESLCSTSPIDVSESVTQTVGQLGALEVEDPFVWTQASELLVTTVTYYIQLQSHIAVKYFGSTLSEDRKLDEVCLSLSNMEQGQMMLNDVISEVEGFVARWKTERAVPEDDTRTQITTDTIDTAVSDALIKSKAYINKPLTLVAEKAATEAAIPALTAARTPANTDPANEGTPSSSAAAASNGTSENNAASTAAAATTPQTPYSEQITSSIDDVLVKINERVSTRIFKKVLEAFFAAILEQIWAAAEPDPAGAAVGLNDPTVCASFMGILEDITAYFSAGLSAKSIEGNALYKRTHQLLLAYGLSTEELITIVRFSTASPPVPLEDKRFEGIKPVVVDSILKMRAKAGDKWAIAYQREGAGSENSSKVRAVLGLPPSELLIEKWACFKGGKTGTLYLMSKNLGFSLALNGDDVEPIIVPLKLITSLKKVSVMVFMKGIEVKTSDDESYVFSKFVASSTDSVIASIIDQARLVGNTSFGSPAEANGNGKK